MKRRPRTGNWKVHGALFVVHACIGVLFLTILTAAAQPDPVSLPRADAFSIPARHVPTLPPLKVGTPSRIVVPSVGIDVSVRTGSYDPQSQSWQISEGMAFFADRSVPANNRNGTTLLYGHHSIGAFGAVTSIQAGATAMVYTDNGLVFQYGNASIQQVTPDDVDVLTVEGAPRLVLQTCSGPFDAYRTLVSFSLITVKDHE